MSDNVEFGARAAVTVAVALCFALARKYLKPSAQLSEQQLSILDARFRHTKWVVGTGMVATGIGFAWATHYAFVSLNHYLAVSDGPDTSFLLWPQTAIWWFFPGFGAVALCWEITLKLWSVFGQADTAKAYRLWSDGRAGFDATRILRWMALVIAAPIGLLTALALPMHTALRHRDIRGGAQGLAREQADRSARVGDRLGRRRLDAGKLHPRAGIVVDFADGRRWSSADTGDFRKNVDPALAAFLTERIRLPLGEAETELDIPTADNNTTQLPRDKSETTQ